MPAKKPYRKTDRWANEKQFAAEVGSGLNDVIGRGTLAGLLGAPGDIAGMAENGIRALIGLPQVQPWGGSEHIGNRMEKAGLVSNRRRPKTELLASLISPAQIATASLKAPQYAKTALRLLDNLDSAPTMARIGQRGAVDTGLLGKMVAPQDEALRVAQQNAAKPVSEGGLGLRPDNTPEERAAAMGFDIPVYHATDQNFTAFDPLKRGTTSDSGWYGDADYTAPSPDYAARFIEKPIDGFVSGVAYKDGGNIMPLLARAENPYDWRANEPMGRGLFQNDRRASIDKRKELQGMGYDSVAVNNSKIFLDDGQELSNEQWDILTSASPMLKSIGKQKVENLIRANNYDFRDFARSYGIDAASAMPQKSDMVELATFNPSQLRSRFAAFDPMRRDSSDLLAGLSPLLLARPQEKDKRK